jgi:hypothetical protein
LLEPQRTNLVTYSEQFDDAAWVKSNITVTANAAISPDGTQNADLLNITSASNYIDQNGTIVSGATYTVSCYVKSAVGSNQSFGIYGNSNKASSVFTATQEWQRFTHTFTADSTAMSAGLFSPAIVQLYAYGFQLELGAYPTTYIPTQAASVTRNTDSFALSNVYDNNMISSAGGTWFADLSNNIDYIRDSGGGGLMLATILNTYNNSITIYNDTSYQRLGVQLYQNSSLLTTYRTTTNRTKVAIKWNGTTADIFANGVKVVSNISFTLTQLQHLSQTNIVDVPKYINSMALWNTPLTDDELEVITGEGFDTYALMASNYNYILQ